MASVVFDSAGFKAQYPEFMGLDIGVVNGCFNQATLFCNNSDASVVTDIPTRTTLLWLLTAHIAKLFYGANGNAPLDVVGRVEVAKEGSVHARADMGPPSGTAAWYNQTQYGAMYLAATARFRTARYIPAVTGVMNDPGSIPAIWPWGRW